MKKLLKQALTFILMNISPDSFSECGSGFVFRGIAYAKGKTTDIFYGLMKSHVFLIDF